jgi:hypothetical protein
MIFSHVASGQLMLGFLIENLRLFFNRLLILARARTGATRPRMLR